MAKPLAPAQLAEQLLAGDRRALARAITLVESSRDDHRAAADDLLARVSASGNSESSFRIGMSGVPGVGKSTLIEALGGYALDAGKRIAVLSVDPSSKLSGGSILGDKTRMETLARDPRAYVRPSPAGSTLGGVARRSREAVLLAEAAGFDLIIVETVGVGQSETAVADMTDIFVLLLLPAGGDELQGIKRGIVELADFILVNKADGALAAAAEHTVADYRSALALTAPRSGGWRVPVLPCSALSGEGLERAWATLSDYHREQRESGRLKERRAAQNRSWLWSEAAAELLEVLKRHPRVSERLPQLERSVVCGDLPATVAARRLISYLFDEG